MLKNKKDILAFQKKCGLIWEDKTELIEHDIMHKKLSLQEVKKRAIGSEGPLHRIIESDNLAALYLLKNKEERFQLIYIDPPYNTGNKDFKYNDHYVDEEDEYRHSKWISFMYKRLEIAKDLLEENGAIFISIDDYEQARLKILCDGIFGQQNFVANFIRKNKSGSGHDSKQVAIEYDYILCYAKEIKKLEFTKADAAADKDKKYNISDQFVKRRGKYYLRDLDYKGSYSKSLDYAITSPDGNEIFSGGAFGKPNTWRWSKKQFEWGVKNEFIVFKKRPNGWKVYIKQYQFVDNKDKKRIRKIPHRAIIDFSNSKGSNELKNIIADDFFSYPKPTDLLQFLINLFEASNLHVLDFFAGSGSTLHATMLANKKDSGKRTCTLVTNNENKICEQVTYQRNKKVIEGFTNRKGKKVEGLKDNQLRYYKILAQDG